MVPAALLVIVIGAGIFGAFTYAFIRLAQLQGEVETLQQGLLEAIREVQHLKHPSP